MFNSEKVTLAPLSIQRLGLRLQPFHYKIEHVGKSKAADSLSQLPLLETEENVYVEPYMYRVLSVTMHDLQAMTVKDIKHSMTEDQTLKQQMTILDTRKWPNPVPKELHPNNRCSDDLSMYD